MHKNVYSTIDWNARRSAQMGMKMKKQILAGILATGFLLLSACGTEGGGDAVSLEPHSLGTAGAAGAAGANGASGSGSDSAGGIPSPTGAGTAAPDGVSGREEGGSGGTAAGAEQGISASGVGQTPPASGTGTGQGTPASGVVAGAGQGTPASGAGTQPAAGISSGTYGDIYLRKVNENDGAARRYSLIYLDADEIPELVVSMGDESYSIYTVKGNELFCMADSVGTVELTYFERSGIIATFSRWNGGGDEGGYGSSYYQTSGDRTLTYDDQPVLGYSYNASYDEKGVYMGTGVTDYFYMGQGIDEAAYEEKMKSLGIAEGEDRLCMEKSYSKEEIAVLLNQ